jgi:hypothetical protein
MRTRKPAWLPLTASIYTVKPADRFAKRKTKWSPGKVGEWRMQSAVWEMAISSLFPFVWRKTTVALQIEYGVPPRTLRRYSQPTAVYYVSPSEAQRLLAQLVAKIIRDNNPRRLPGIFTIEPVGATVASMLNTYAQAATNLTTQTCCWLPPVMTVPKAVSKVKAETTERAEGSGRHKQKMDSKRSKRKQKTRKRRIACTEDGRRFIFTSPALEAKLEAELEAKAGVKSYTAACPTLRTVPFIPLMQLTEPSPLQESGRALSESFWDCLVPFTLGQPPQFSSDWLEFK